MASEFHAEMREAGMAAPEEGSLLDRVLEPGLPAAGRDPPSPLFLTGRLESIDEEGRVLFVGDGDGSPVPVVLGTDLPDEVLREAVRARRPALVVRIQESRPRLVLIGLLRDALGASPIAGRPLNVEVDGKTVVIEAREQIELKCGSASLLLRQDGRVVLSGTYVVSTSQGPNKIKGATIALN